MANFTVTTGIDFTWADDGTLTLREALAAADATPEADIVSFDLTAMGGNRISLEGSQLSAVDVIIDGGSGVEITANARSRVLATGGDVTLVNLAITGGKTSDPEYPDDGGPSAGGAGIIVAGSSSLELRGCTICNNVATGTYAGGGGILSSGEYTTISIVNSTIANNSTHGTDFFASGGAIRFHYVGSLEITNSTITNNYSATIGGGVSLQLGAGVDFTLNNSILAGNQVALSRMNDVSADGMASNGHNIFGSDVPGNAPGDLENVSTDLLFAGGLADNGGPTQTIALRNAADNPALGGADPADAPTTDQRGVARPQPDGTNPDIGAFELNQSTGGGDILGTARADRLTGTAQADVIRGLAGDDLLLGLAGNDRLFGDGQDDRLVGGLGLDQLSGGRGCDRFVYRSLAEAPVAGPRFDEVLDFSRLQHDRIDVSRIDAKAGVTGNQVFTFIGQAEFSAASQLHYQATADGDFLVSGNVDRDPDADFAIVVRTGSTSLLAGDFLL